MDKNFGYFIFLSLLICALFGFGLGSVNGYPYHGLGIGALVGAFLGWFVAAAAHEQQDKTKQ